MLNRTLPHVWKLLKEPFHLASEEPAGADITTKEKFRRNAVEKWMASFPDRDALKRALESANLAWGEVRTSATTLDSPTVAARGVAASVEDDEGNLRLGVQSPYRFSDAESGVAGPAPRLGQHNAAVLVDWLGLDEEKIGSLRGKRILTDTPPE
jgi:CoA:oxalate CoA-transferase